MFVLLTLVLLIREGCSENTNFNYTDHGRNWKQGNCQNGTTQSPIILQANASVVDSFLFGAYANTNASIAFYNTTTYINGSFGQLFTQFVGGKAVPLRATQVRLRCMSEHAIQTDSDTNPMKFPLELQIFHVLVQPESTNERAAIAILFQIGNEPDPIIQQIIDAEKSNSSSISIDLSYYIKRGNTFSYWLYLGSPTIPSCTDGSVNWIVVDKRFPITQEQAAYFKKSFYGEKQPDGNYRQLQITQNLVGYYKFGR